jgi:hypothetical protein
MKKGFVIGVVFMLMFVTLIAANRFAHKLIIKEAPEIELSNGEKVTNVTDGTVSITDGTNTLGSIVDLGSNGAFNADQFRLGITAPTATAAYGTVMVKVWNKGVSASDIAANDVVQLDTAAVELAADTTKANRLVRITNNIKFGCYAYIRVNRPATTNADTIRVWGKDPSGTAQTESIIGPAGSLAYNYSAKLYSDVDSMRTSYAGNTGNYAFDAMYYMTVIASAGANAQVFGVANSAIADSGGTGWVVTHGPVVATVDAATLNATMGTTLQGASAGDAVTIATAKADTTANGKILGYAIQPGYKDNTAILIFVDKK